MGYGVPHTTSNCFLGVKIGIFAVFFGAVIIISTYYHGTLSDSVLDRKSRGISDKYTKLINGKPKEPPRRNSGKIEDDVYFLKKQMEEVMGGSKELGGVIRQLQKGHIKQRDITNKGLVDTDTQLYEEIRNLNKTSLDIDEERKNLNERLDQLGLEIEEINEWRKSKKSEELSDLSKVKQNELEKGILELSSRVDNIQTRNKGSPVIPIRAFMVTLLDLTSLPPNYPLTFDRIVYNFGDVWDIRRKSFLCKDEALYMFHLSYTNWKNDMESILHIYFNKKEVAGVRIRPDDQQITASTSAMVLCKIGSEVAVKTGDAALTYVYGDKQGSWTSFSGYRVGFVEPNAIEYQPEKEPKLEEFQPGKETYQELYQLGEETNLEEAELK